MKVKENGVYKDYKGDKYLVCYVAKHTDTNEEMVVYVSKDVGDPRVWVCPVSTFFGDVKEGDYEGPRFTFVETHYMTTFTF